MGHTDGLHFCCQEVYPYRNQEYAITINMYTDRIVSFSKCTINLLVCKYRFLDMFSVANRHYSNQKLYSHLRIVSVLLVIGLASISILDYYYISSNKGIGALPEAAYIKDRVGEEGAGHFSYYSSIFSNLSRGLPIDNGISSTEPLNGQQADEVDNINPIDQGPQPQQEQEQVQEPQASISNNNP
jgi:hypothetical protein